MSIDLSLHQIEVIEAPLEHKMFLAGPAGTGKTTSGVARMVHLLESGVPAGQLLVIVPQRTLAAPYDVARHSTGLADGGLVEIVTIGGLARRMVDLFWPLVAEAAGFAHPEQRPTFLTLETSQYYMARLVRPLILDDGYFESLTIERNRLYSQVLDNLSKAAVVGFPYTEIGTRLKAAWVGEPAQSVIYDQVQVCANRFRDYCLEHNLLDFSLQMELFREQLWDEPLCYEHLMGSYPHLIVDNLEENTPVAHDLLRDWLGRAQSALLIADQEAGYRSFLGADFDSALTLRAVCDGTVTFTHSFVTTPALTVVSNALGRSIRREPREQPVPVVTPKIPLSEAVDSVLHFTHHRYHPEMLEWVAEQIHLLVHEQDVPPGEIVVLAPYLTDALRFALTNRLETFGIPTRSHRPSRSLREEPATRCLLTFAALVHPQWKLIPTHYDVAYALVQAISGLDLVRAHLLARTLYRDREGIPTLESFEDLNPDMQARITYLMGGRYEALHIWLQDALTDNLQEEVELDHFLSRLFGEVLSQPGFGFHQDFDAGQVTANLIESVQKFRWVIGENIQTGQSLGCEYIHMVQDGVVAAQYIRPWQIENEDAVLLTPAYTFLMRNQPVDVQFWLDVGGQGWWERVYQPLTHPYVLSRDWQKDELWTDEFEFATRQDALYRLVMGLVRRCRNAIYLGLSELGERGYEQQGVLLRAFQRVLRDAIER